MKINEFIKEVNKFAAANKDGDGIYIAEAQDDLEFGNWFFIIWPKQQIMSKNWDWDCLGTISPKNLQKFFSLVDELERTPVKERFSGRKYTVRVLKDSGSFLNKNLHTGSYCFYDAVQSEAYQAHFTQAEIDELEQRDDIAIDWDKAIVKEVD